MLLAIDVGNSNTVFALHDGTSWCAEWRRRTDPEITADELGVWLRGAFDLAGITFKIDAAICGSVVARVNAVLEAVCQRFLKTPLKFLQKGSDVGLPVDYDPPDGIGADRLANALGALAKYAPPVLVVDFGTATTFDAVDKDGRFVGGAILPGLGISAEALFQRAPRLPRVPFKAPDNALAKNTVEALQSGIMFTYAGGIDALVTKIGAELGGPKVIATGGLANYLVGLCQSIDEFDGQLTLEGLRIAADLL